MSNLHAVVAQIERDSEAAIKQRAERNYRLAAVLAAIAAVIGGLFCLASFVAMVVVG